ncbi:hypothetical protein BDZ89DRAFT_439384 [Hymenopellis radicata]|nr:hypothetical protein BDZ89DRAFT_439384 [Hymenopellis radicata]
MSESDTDTPPASPSTRSKSKLQPKIGNIPGYPSGSLFKNRKELYDAGLHLQWKYGIHGRRDEGAFAVVISDGYPDDLDYWQTVYYTGSGGHERNVAVHTKDQTWLRGNGALRVSWIAHQPVRVIRSDRCSCLKYPVPKGYYRYDGLYMVTDAKQVKGKDGLLICRFTLQRLIDQDCPPESWHDAALEPLVAPDPLSNMDEDPAPEHDAVSE